MPDHNVPITLYNVTFPTIIATTFIHRIYQIEHRIDSIRDSIKARISETTVLITQFADLTKRNRVALERFQRVSKWTEHCNDVLHLGRIMSCLEESRVAAIRYFFHENPALQVFAYICE